MGKKISLKYEWEFLKQKIEGEEIPESFSETDVFRPVVIPHDWLMEGFADLYEDSVGWYRRKLVTGEKNGKKFFLRFEGIYMNSTVFVNGQKAGGWMYGYTTFEVDITPYVCEGENEILVKVVHQMPNSRWYTGAGIYRPVWLVERNETHFAADGIYVHTEKEGNGYRTEISAELCGTKEVLSECEITYTLSDMENNRVLTTMVPAALGEIEFYAEDVKEWSIEAPSRYVLLAELKRNGEVLDTEHVIFGYRTIELTTDRGMFLNGTHVKLNGVCLHHDLGCLGAAVNKGAIKRQFQLMKEMGANAIRTAHNMPAVEFMELADEMGFLVVSESFDCWKKPKNKYDYARFFEDWAERDVKNWIRRDRNHPSVFMWSVGNEIFDMHADEAGQETLCSLMAMVKEHDPKENAYATFGSNFMPWENTQKCADIIKIVGYNYAEKLYEKHHREHPDWMIYGSETGSIVQSRGIYHFPYEKEILADDDEQCSSLGNSITSWGAKSIEFCITKERDTEFSLGQFLWSGIDYIGEPTPYHGRNSYFGQADTACFKKDAFYLYQAEWTDYKKAPMIHIFPYWDFNEGQLIDVRVCSNAPEIELFFAPTGEGEVSLGRVQIDHVHGEKLTGDWRLPYRKGTLRAVAYDENGEIIATDVQTSFGDAKRICLSADRTELPASDEELVFVTVSMEDEDGNPVHNANNRVRVNVSGAGELVGLDNGDSTDFEPYHTMTRRLFSGKLLVVIRSNGNAGEIKIVVSSAGMEETTLCCYAVKNAENTETAEVEKNRAERESTHILVKKEDCIKIPIRKIALSAEETHLTPEKRETKVTATVYPDNADEQELYFRVTDAVGVDSTFATVKKNPENGREALIEVRGDGEFYVRCMCKNGREKVSLISMLEMKAEGLGILNLNPYEFLSASLFTKSGGDIGNGNERGISTARDGVSWVAFENLDFGEFGSDTVTIPVFSFGETPFTFWEGIPHAEGSSIIGTADYTIPSVWNTYLPDTFHLDKRLKGITTFAVELDRKIHMKGFQFAMQEKAYTKLYAAEADRIYGDSFRMEDKEVKNIGNNVTLVFEHMEFSEGGATKLYLYGKTTHEVNDIRLLTEYEDGTTEQESLTFTFSEEEKEMEFSLNKKQGKAKVSFVFLPGSAFDFSWLKFERLLP